LGYETIINADKETWSISEIKIMVRKKAAGYTMLQCKCNENILEELINIKYSSNFYKITEVTEGTGIAHSV
jgi:hypothetical protein